MANQPEFQSTGELQKQIDRPSGLFTSLSRLTFGSGREQRRLRMTEEREDCVPAFKPFTELDWHPGFGLNITQEDWVIALCPGDHLPIFQRREYREGEEIDHYKCLECGQGETKRRLTS